MLEKELLKRMKVSIVTVSYNAEKTIADTVNSVLSQSYHDIEYIIVDGASKDKTLEVLETFEKGKFKLISEPDKGLYDAMNKGLGLATGDIIGILNADDVFSENGVVQEVVNKMNDSGADCLYSDLNYVKDDLKTIVRKWVSGNYVKGAFKKGWMPPHPTFYVKRECYEKYGTFNLDFKTSADYELMLRFIHKHELSVVYLPKTTILMRVGGQSNASIKNRIRANKEDRAAWKVNGLKAGNLTFIRKPLSKIKQFVKK